MTKPFATVAVPYRRYSNASQGTGSSEHRQTTGFDLFLVNSGCVASPDAYFDRGESAYHGQHRSAEFGRLLADCQARKFPQGSVIWVEDMDRFGRGKLHVVMGDWETVIGAGYKIHVASCGQTFDAKTGEMEKITVIMKSILAHEESEKKSIRGKVNRERIRQSGKTKDGMRLAACPFWLKPNAVGEYDIIPEKAEIVREAMRLALSHGGTDIAKIMGTGNLDIVSMVRNRAIIGEFAPFTGPKRNLKQLPTIIGRYPNIDTDNIFHSVQSALDSRRTMRGRKGKFVTNLFTELLYGSDGHTMFVKAESRLRVVKRRTPCDRTEYRTYPYVQVETTLLRFLKELSITPSTKSDTDKLTAELTQVTKRLEQIKLRILADDNLDALIDTVSHLSSRAKDLTRLIEVEKGKVPEVTTLSQTHAVLVALDAASGADLLQLRTQLRAAIRRLVTRIDITIDRLPTGKTATYAIHLVSGDVRKVVMAASRSRKVTYSEVTDASGTIEVWSMKVQ